MKFIFAIVCTLLVLGLLAECAANLPTDDTDASSMQRSGMEIKIDYGTGCEYLHVYKGGLTPRLDAQGKHICDSLNQRAVINRIKDR